MCVGQALGRGRVRFGIGIGIGIGSDRLNYRHRRMAAALLGEDGRGYELARRLDGCGAWRAWLGDGAYAAFVHHLSSPASWETFMSPSPSSPSNSRAHLHLQLRVRALLFDKASAALFFHPASSPGNSAPSISEINPDCKR